MSRENTDYDVSVALYDATKKSNIARIVFYNDTEILLECNRVKLVREGDRLYFHKGDAIKNSIKLSGKLNDTLQLWSDYDKVKDLEGLYDAKYDKDLDLYYIDKNERLSDYDGHKYTIKGSKQVNHNAPKREKRGETVMTAVLTERGKKVVEAGKGDAVSKTAATDVVVKALLTLLKTQVEGNKEALDTIDALEKFI